jgi:hypothetical protein
MRPSTAYSGVRDAPSSCKGTWSLEQIVDDEVVRAASMLDMDIGGGELLSNRRHGARPSRSAERCVTAACTRPAP